MQQIPHPRFLMFLAVLAAGSALAALALPLPLALVTGFDAAACAFLLSALPLWLTATPEAMRAHAARDDGGRTLLPGIAAIVLAVLLLSLGLMIGSRASLSPGDVSLVLATLLLAWGFVNLVYAFHYAHLYYDAAGDGADRGGLGFPGTDLPVFSDFAYFAFTIGMTFQVSDVPITASPMRRTATLHALLAFLFNLGILALTINILAGIL